VIIRPEQALSILKDLPIGALHGIGKKVPGAAEKHGNPYVRDFWQLPLEKVVQMFGKFGYDLYHGPEGRTIGKSFQTGSPNPTPARPRSPKMYMIGSRWPEWPGACWKKFSGN